MCDEEVSHFVRFMMSYDFARRDFEQGNYPMVRYAVNCSLKERVDAAHDYPVSTVLENLRLGLAEELRTHRLQ